ncbi:putative phosphoglycolate phosphatase, bacterial [Candidatus Moduliflexus flocculans]|uniref:Putative phosphoglycolate phosphatase, bacterial n=1 Tax=Candidatus Moduliflexus flocculans TaxID=1499966 RepID=A0A0S6VVY1_9BACT|nr:putative phosphoglycolate phosphatase, bacterial [Candidatus Moduliflexus flocculans]
MTYHAILFDLDGTLLNTLEDLANATNDALTAFGLPTHPVDAYRYFIGEGAKNLMKNALPPAQRTEKIIQQCLALFRENYERTWDRATRPYDGVPEMLTTVQSKQVNVAVLSNKPDDFTRKCVEQLLSSWQFTCVFGQRDGVPRKPDPTAALEIAKILKCDPAEMLYVGDSGTDMQTAVAAGMFPVGALWGFREREELLSNGAKMLIAHPSELLDLL